MSALPQLGDTDFTERAGINYVAVIVNSARCIWRELLHRDIGIDGHIEYITPTGGAPGRIVAVQVKSGKSWFRRTTDDFISYSVSAKHSAYWERYPLPVILILHNPDTYETVWTDARALLRSCPDKTVIKVSRHNRFDADGVLHSLATDGPLPEGEFQVEAILREMAKAEEAAQGLSFITLFAQGMTNIAHSLFFSMQIVSEALDYNCAKAGQSAYTVGSAEFEFVDSYVDFIVENDLARIDYGAWMQSSSELGMVGNFIAPLTQKGRLIRDRITEIDKHLTQNAPAPTRRYFAIQERFVSMLINRMGEDEFSIRQKYIDSISDYIVRTSVEPDS
ncbi:DUF4365 domain-containing protein [Nocardia sp. GTS18]|uniref:DUF4365 domain-containing protein n=1 Tax=Nocardia sp. GTS18 TaxID=1778064 RepID=UPI0015EF2AD1|nr:DUF4365 domain-containing protein [Nocardia sp. GTS18]